MISTVLTNQKQIMEFFESLKKPQNENRQNQHMSLEENLVVQATTQQELQTLEVGLQDSETYRRVVSFEIKYSYTFLVWQPLIKVSIDGGTLPRTTPLSLSTPL